jgi:hypothetical protein
MRKDYRIKELEDFIRENIVDAMFISKSRLIIKAKEILDDSERNEQDRDPTTSPSGSSNRPR